MTPTRHTDTTAAWLACAECQAPLDATQRYCVTCGARHAEADNPAARYFGAMAQRRRAVAPRPARRGVGIGIAILLAVLPLAVGLGVVVGRSGQSDSDLLQALKNQKPTVVNVAGGGAGGGSAADSTDTSGADNGAASGDTGSGEVVATGVGGAAHSVLHHKSTADSRARDKQVVRRISQQTGKKYIDSQRDLPDVIDVQSDPGAGTTAPTGPGD